MTEFQLGVIVTALVAITIFGAVLPIVAQHAPPEPIWITTYETRNCDSQEPTKLRGTI
jgi:hypothetical protein